MSITIKVLYNVSYININMYVNYNKRLLWYILWKPCILILACKTHHTIIVYTTFFLKMNPRFRNTKSHQIIKNWNINLGNVHFFDLYCTMSLSVESGWDRTLLLLLERKRQLEISKQFPRTHLPNRWTDFPKF